MIRLALLSFGLVLAAAEACAATALPVPLQGFVDGSSTSGISGGCILGAGASLIQRFAETATAHQSAIISFPTLVREAAAPKPHTVSSFMGTAGLKFADASSGTITFDRDTTRGLVPPGESFPFTSYTQNLVPKDNLLHIRFVIVFPECSVPFHAAYRTGA